MTNMKEDNNTNYGLFLNVVSSLKNSQGFYSRLYNQIQKMNEEQRLELEEQINNIEPKFKDVVDVILYLEG